MQGRGEIVELLNECLVGEVVAVNQYVADAKMFSNWGFERLGARFRDESADEQRDVDRLIERILYLDGVPDLQWPGGVQLGATPVEKLELALQLEREAIDRLNRGIALCVTHRDNGSRALLEAVLEGEERHADWLETQLDVIATIGEQLYLAEQLHG